MSDGVSIYRVQKLPKANKRLSPVPMSLEKN